MFDRTKVIQRPSPNFTAAPGRMVGLVIVHATDSPTAEGAIKWLCTPPPENPHPVSAHYVIDYDGTIYQLVDEENVAWHAGVSEWKGLTRLNLCSIGIELQNENDGEDPYPDAQVNALTDLVRDILQRHSLEPDAVVRHLDVALPAGRKTDPAGFPWAGWKELLEGAPAKEA